MKLPAGKVPQEILQKTVFKFLGAEREDVILGPALGEDAAIVKAGGKLLALSCDPVSGAVRRVGWIAAHVACNDVATRGVKPQWLSTVILLPEGSTSKLLTEISRQIDEASSQLGVAVVGGHSETAPGISHPIVVGFASGVVRGGKYVRTGGAKPGAKLLMSKAAGLEGTAILASDFERLVAGSLGWKATREAQKFYLEISVVREALAAFRAGGVQAMHDPTEGGLAGGLHELAEASGVGFRIWEEQVAFRSETLEVCRLFSINPLALISSGCLLLAVEEEAAERVLKAVRRVGVEVCLVGETLEDPSRRIIIDRHGRTKKLPKPSQDELWKALARPLGK
ncbi:MAG: AIR synthase family protein [Candidatus Hecatellaceae archaeon]|nr:MAG: hydrogenase [Candidatus Hecatellales archaeon]